MASRNAPGILISLFTAGFVLAAAPGAQGQDADSLVMPVRKGGESANSESAKADESKVKPEEKAKPEAEKPRSGAATLAKLAGASRGSSADKPATEASKPKEDAPAPRKTSTPSRSESKTADADAGKSGKAAPSSKSYDDASDRRSGKSSDSDADSKSASSRSTRRETASDGASAKSAERKAAAADSGRSSSRSEARDSDVSFDREQARSESAEKADPDLLVIKNLRPGTNVALQEPGNSAAPAADPAAPAASAGDSNEESGEESGAAAAVMSVPAATPVPVYSNAYIPQATEEKRSFLSRIFNRHKAAAPTAPAGPQTPFSSDYATRGDAVLPAVISGNGYNGQDLPIGGEDQFRLASLPSSFRPTDLVQIPVDCCHYGNQLYLRSEAAGALNRMISDAAAQGLRLRVVSAYRDYGHQMRLYTQAVARGGINQKSVARPGKSEHHLGTTVDLTNNEDNCLNRSFGDTAEGRWLAANASKYGWKMTVMSGSGRRDHNDEPWHLRYLGSAVNTYTRGNSAVAQQPAQPQRRGILSSIGHILTLGRR